MEDYHEDDGVMDLLESVNPNDSDFFESDDEYTPSHDSNSDSDSDDYDMPSTSKKRKRAVTNRKAHDQSVDEDDNIPLSRLRDQIRADKERIAQNEEEEILSQMFDQPMWVKMPYNPADVPFLGAVENVPDELQSPFQFFKKVVSDNMIQEMANQSNIYALSKNGMELKTNEKEMERFIGMYLKMGLMKAHRTRAYWARQTRYPPIADVMPRNRYDVLCSNIHFADNNMPQENDRLWKIRPWVNQMRDNLGKILPSEMQSVDEIMIAFKGKSTVKQYMRNKPHKWGFKLWARTGSEGICHDFDIYQGSQQGTQNSYLGVAGDVVMNMTSKLEEGKNFKIFADNFFSSLKLVKALREKGMWYVGTVRENRLQGCNLKPEKELKKEQRGAIDSLVDCDSNTIAVRWYDNKRVEVISSFVGVEPVQKVRRYDKKLKEKIDVTCPAVIHCYNKHMGGVDLLDSLTSLYKAKVKTRRWYIYIFYHSVNMALVTSWLWYRRHCQLLDKMAMKLSDFLADVADGLILVERKPGRPSLEEAECRRRPTGRSSEIQPTADVRLDMVNHWPEYSDRQWCKLSSCKQKTFLKCSKCGVHLCLNKDRNCFRAYHTN